MGCTAPPFNSDGELFTHFHAVHAVIQPIQSYVCFSFLPVCLFHSGCLAHFPLPGRWLGQVVPLSLPLVLDWSSPVADLSAFQHALPCSQHSTSSIGVPCNAALVPLPSQSDSWSANIQPYSLSASTPTSQVGAPVPLGHAHFLLQPPLSTIPMFHCPTKAGLPLLKTCPLKLQPLVLRPVVPSTAHPVKHTSSLLPK